HAPNPSLRERASKWLRRHPRAVPLGGFVAAALLVVGLGIAFAGQSAARQRDAALRQAAAFAAALPGLPVGLDSPSDPLRPESAGKRAREALAGYGLPDDAGCRNRQAFRALPPERRARLEADLGEALVLLTQSGLRFGPANRDELLRLNRLA